LFEALNIYQFEENNNEENNKPEPATILKQYFGYDTFRVGQEDVVQSILNKEDALAIMPTGAGKSLCYQIPALLMDGITLVISPLISLMQDQVQALKQVGIPSAYINSSLSQNQINNVVANAQDGLYKIIYIAPERLDAPTFTGFVHSCNVSMVAIDEAHCVSQWGQDFRPSYLNIAGFINSLAIRPVVSAFTATATDIVKEDVINLLGLKSPFLCNTGFNRENLYFEVRHPSDKFSELSKYVESGQSGIIYCSTRKTVDEITTKLREAGIQAEKYHAGMNKGERLTAQNNFIYDKSPIIVATNAFGMGIDKSNVAFVIHYNMPKNMESYYQEAGRAGRDGSPAECLLLFNYKDVAINKFLINGNESSAQKKATDYKLLQKIERYCKTTGCLRQYILDYFQDSVKVQCNNCSNCLTDHEMIDFTVEAQKILSCAKRMKGRFGAVMLVSVLRGEKSKKVTDAALDQLTTYGILPKPAKELRFAVEYLTQQGYLQTTDGRFPLITTTQKAAEILLEKKAIQIPKYREQKGNRKRASASKPQGRYAVNTELFEELKNLRLQIAKSQDVPAFVVFSDATLYDMCSKLPTTEAEFLDVSGVGQMKLEKYGTQFLDVIQKFKSSGTEIKQRTEIIDQNEIAKLFDNFEFPTEPVTLSGFLQSANILLLQIKGRGASSNKLARLLEDDGYLEMCEIEDGRRRSPTEKGLEMGIYSKEVESQEGRVYMQNFYGVDAQKILLRYIREMI